MRILIAGPRRWNNINHAGQYTDALGLWLSHQLYTLGQNNPQGLYAGSSLHLGLDTIFALTCLREQIPLYVFLACEDQDRFWGEEERRKFADILGKAQSVQICSPGSYTQGCIAKQTKSLTDWLVKEPNTHKPVLLTIRPRYVRPSLQQIERERAVRSVNGLVQELRLR